MATTKRWTSSVSQEPGPLSPSYRGRVPRVSASYRGHAVHHEPGPHILVVARKWHTDGTTGAGNLGWSARQRSHQGFSRWRRWCCASGHRKRVSQDIGNRRVGRLGDVQGPVDHHGGGSRGPFRSPPSLPSTACRRAGSASSWPATAPKATSRSNPGHGAPRPHPPRSTRPSVELIVKLRHQLVGAGLDAGPDTIHWHLGHHHQTTVSVSTIARTLTRAQLVTPEPKKRPRSSYIRFEADQPNECWQSDFTHYPLANGIDTEILSWLDDHSRYALRITAHQPVTGPIVLHTFRAAGTKHGYPASTLTDNGMVFTARFAGGRGGRNALRSRTPPPRHRPEEQPAEPPHHLRESRAVPTDPQTLARPPASTHNPRRAPDPPRHVPPHLQPTASSPLTPAARHARHHLHRTTQSHPHRTRRPPLPSPPRPHRRQRRRHPPRRRPTPSHRDRTNPRPNPRHPPRPRPPRPRRRRRHRRTPPSTHHRPHPRLPTHRRTQRPHPTQKETPRTQLRVRSVSHLLRDDIGGDDGTRTHDFLLAKQVL